MREPRDFARDANQFAIPDGSGDRFSGYAIFGLPFSSGHVLALRCFAASSLGAAYTSVWHRDPKGRWNFHQNVSPELACPRYFGAAITQNTTSPIRIDWADQLLFPRDGSCTGRDRLGHPARDDACDQDDEYRRKRSARFVVEEAVRALHHGDGGTMDAGGRRDETGRPHAEWPRVCGDAATDLVGRGEPGDDTRGRCGRAGSATETGNAGRPLYTAARNLRHRHSSAGRLGARCGAIESAR